jgi:hypothetical protein
MVILRWLGPGVILVSGAVAQQRVHLFDCRDMEANLAKFTGKERSVPDLCRLLTRVFEGAGRTRVMPNGETNYFVQGTPDQIETAKSAHAQLARPDLQELRVQCTVVTMPLDAATAAGLAAGKVLEVDEASAGKVIKAAVAAKGAFRNLPEEGGLPLQPFVLGKAAEQKPRNAAEMMAGSQVRIEALPLSAAEAWFALQWTGELPGDGAKPATKSEFEACMRLKVGGGAMVMSAQGKQAVVLWLRLPFTKDAQPHKGR